MDKDQGFSVNSFDALAVEKRERNGWGFTKEDLERHGVTMVTEVRLIWPEDTPPEMRQVFGEASLVLHYIAERAIMAQLEHDGLKPTQRKDLLYATGEDGKTVLLRQSDWQET
jgi:hypothetical protein